MNINTVLAKHKFDSATGESPTKLIVSVEGEQKHGKDHFAFTAPGPIAAFSFDPGTIEVANKFKAGLATVNGDPIPPKDIYLHRYDMALTTDTSGKAAVQVAAEGFDYKRVWKEFNEAYMDFLESGIPTIVWDTGTTLYDLVKLMHAGRTGQIPEWMWGPLKADYRGMILKAVDYGSNLIILHRMGPEYVKNVSTGGRVMKGYADTYFEVDVAVRAVRTDEEGGGSKYSVKVLDSRSSDANGRTLEGEFCSFPWLGSFLVDGTTPEDWE